jgi:hypothetical protein
VTNVVLTANNVQQATHAQFVTAIILFFLTTQLKPVLHLVPKGISHPHLSMELAHVVHAQLIAHHVLMLILALLALVLIILSLKGCVFHLIVKIVLFVIIQR